MNTIAGVILAGGKATRLGTPKAKLLLEGEPLILRPLRVLRSFCHEVAVAHGGARGRRDLEEVVGDALLVPDEEIGPLGGLVAGLRAVEGPWTAVAPCDAPLLSVELYRALLSLAQDVDAAVVRTSGKQMPVVAVYRREAALRAGLQALRSGQRAMHQMLSHLEVRHADEEVLRRMPHGVDCVLDVDTWEDLERARNLLRTRPPGRPPPEDDGR